MYFNKFKHYCQETILFNVRAQTYLHCRLGFVTIVGTATIAVSVELCTLAKQCALL